MKKIKFLSIVLLASLVFTACSKDEPAPVNEEEVITTMTITLQPTLGSEPTITLRMRDLDGDGPEAPVITVSGDLTAGVTYNGSIELLNETETPAEDITVEVVEEANDHQFFYTIEGGLDITTDYTSLDGNGNPLGTEFTLVAGAASSGMLTFTLRHEPKKPNTGLADAGGETDIETTFNITVK